MVLNKKSFRLYVYILGICLTFFLIIQTAQSQDYSFSNPWGAKGLKIISEDSRNITLTYSISDFSMENLDVNGESLKKIELPGHFLFGNPGAPDLPGDGRYIAIPDGAVPVVTVTNQRIVNYSNVNISPAPALPIDSYGKKLSYSKDPDIYNRNEYYPANPVVQSQIIKLRGVNVLVLGITPFQYNPVTKDLRVYRDLKINIEMKGGNGQYGEERLRSRYWDGIMADVIMNYNALPKINYEGQHHEQNGSRDITGCEYLIISPNDAVFQQWADTIKQFRTEQGIQTEVVTLAEIGGDDAALIEAYIDNAYNTWDPVPSAVLLLGDHGADANNTVASSVRTDHPYNGVSSYISDNTYADVNGDMLPDIAFARIVARNASELQVMIDKFINYERNPPTDPNFYSHPITALGWQTERWFQICSEVVGGFFANALGKSPVRINAVYGGNPDTDPWSTASNTSTVVNYFGPSGLGYIPATPAELGNWTGGTAAGINTAINQGAFLLQHRDHGYTQGWGEPSYNTTSVNSLTNTNNELPYVMSVNCQTGKFNNSTECLAEKFYRYTYNGTASGALGVMAPTEISYSFVNDVYTWGVYDYLWPEFMPDYGSNPVSRGLMPCFGNVAGKYFLQQSSWTSGQVYKNITYNLFHHHGDAFLTLYSEVPQTQNVIHDPYIASSSTEFEVTADSGAFLALTLDGAILETHESNGNPI